MVAFSWVSAALFAISIFAAPFWVMAWSPISVSRTLHVDGQPFYLPIEPITTLPGLSVSDVVLPFTTITTNSSQITGETIKNAITSFKSLDDVFSDSFLRGELCLSFIKSTPQWLSLRSSILGVLIIGKGSAVLASSAITYLAELGVLQLFVSGVISVSSLGNVPTTKVSNISVMFHPPRE